MTSASWNKWNKWNNEMNARHPIPCELCGDSTMMLGTQRCDRCYELERRIKADKRLALRILAALGATSEAEKAARFAGFLNVDSYTQYLELVAAHDEIKDAVRDYLKANSTEDGAAYEHVVKLIKLVNQ